MPKQPPLYAAQGKETAMKLLCFSDSHGNPAYMQEMIARHRTADAVIFWATARAILRQCAYFYPETAFYSVRGNCDFGADPPDELCSTSAARAFSARTGTTTM